MVKPQQSASVEEVQHPENNSFLHLPSTRSLHLVGFGASMCENRAVSPPCLNVAMVFVFKLGMCLCWSPSQ